MENNIMETINTVYKSNLTLEEQEILKLDSLLTKVGGNAKSILLKAEDTSMADFIDTCIRNGITFELRNDNSEAAPISNDKPLPVQSPSDKYNSCEKGCMGSEVRLTRITLKNWKELLSVGDMVVSMDDKGNDGLVQKITDLEDDDYRGRGFMELNDRWVFLDEGDRCADGWKYYVQYSGDKEVYCNG